MKHKVMELKCVMLGLLMCLSFLPSVRADTKILSEIQAEYDKIKESLDRLMNIVESNTPQPDTTMTEGSETTRTHITTEGSETVNPDTTTEGPHPDPTTEGSDPDTTTTEGPHPDTTTEGADPDTTTEGSDPNTTTEGPHPDPTTEGSDPDTTTTEGPHPDTTTEGSDPGTTTQGSDPDTTSTEGSDPDTTTTEGPHPDTTAESSDPDTTTQGSEPDTTSTEGSDPDTTTESPHPDTTAGSSDPDTTTESSDPDTTTAESSDPDTTTMKGSDLDATTEDFYSETTEEIITGPDNTGFITTLPDMIKSEEPESDPSVGYNILTEQERSNRRRGDISDEEMDEDVFCEPELDTSNDLCTRLVNVMDDIEDVSQDIANGMTTEKELKQLQNASEDLDVVVDDIEKNSDFVASLNTDVLRERKDHLDQAIEEAEEEVKRELNNQGGSKDNTLAIVLGTLGGVLGVALIAGGGYMFYTKRYKLRNSTTLLSKPRVAAGPLSKLPNSTATTRHPPHRTTTTPPSTPRLHTIHDASNKKPKREVISLEELGDTNPTFTEED
ncbi:hypothetical protein Pcinc_005866 [Petrolisthes cinctipes]|uniref:Uncharacterized protein n=1 Tax=Petrolisthes cinctipes TaxID=88211 RepID=A0AAE1GBT9_PETCI|nr:hypothetical protein Pcinc_005866 [Petrolisthes cinctipes]